MIKVTFALRRRKDLSMEEFNTYLGRTVLRPPAHE
jgi:hypothetical protein